MRSIGFLSGAVRVAALSTLVLLELQGVPAAARPKAPDPVPAPPPPPPPPPSVSLSNNIVRAAAAYQAYVRQAEAQVPGFQDGQAIQTSLQKSEAFEPKALARDEVAYAAVIALQDPAFVEAVRVYVVDPTQRAEMVRRIETDPNYAMAFPGAETVAKAIVAKLAADGEAISRGGYAIKQSAYAIQHLKWSKEWVADRDGRLARAKDLSETPFVAPTDEGDAMMQAALTGHGLSLPPQPGAVTPTGPALATVPGALGAPASGAAAASPAPTPAAGPVLAGSAEAVAAKTDPNPAPAPVYSEGVRRGVAVAALAALGAAGDADDAQVEPLLDEGIGAVCLKLAKLNLFQCLAVAKPHYEDVFCLGQHALMDTGECLRKVAGVTPIDFSPVPAPKKKATKPTRATHRAKGRHQKA